MKELAVFRCYKCASALEESEYYISDSGEKIPIDNIEIVDVPEENCECCAKSQRKRMKPVTIDKTDEEPWEVVFWEDDYERDQGISSNFGYYETFEDAYDEAIRGAHINDWAAFEVRLNTGETKHSVYCYATTKPRADEFINF